MQMPMLQLPEPHANRRAEAMAAVGSGLNLVGQENMVTLDGKGKSAGGWMGNVVRSDIEP